jgi:putative aldouronate transport system substrate-binding protein
MTRKLVALLLALLLVTPAALAAVPAFDDIDFPDNMPAGIIDGSGFDYSYDDLTERYSVEILATNYGIPTPSSENDPIAQWLSKQFNLDITLTTVTGSDLESVISTRFAANDAPDVIQMSSKDLAFTLSDAGLLMDAKELYPYLPLHQKYVTKPMLTWSTNKNGEIPFITKYGIQDGVWAIAIRQDWLDALGMEMPATREELVAFAKAVTFDDPDGNGVADTYFMTGAGDGRSFGMLGSAFGTMAGPNMTYVNEEGVFCHPYFDGTRKEFLAFVKELYDLNVLAPDWYTIQWENAKAYTLNDKIGMVYYPAGSLYQEYTNAKGNKSPETVGAWRFMAQYPIEGGKYPAAGNPGYLWAFSKSGFEGQEGKLKRVLHMIDTMAIGGENFSHTAQSGDDAVYEAYGLTLVGSQEFVFTDDGMFYIRKLNNEPSGAQQFPYDDNSYGGLNLATWQNFGLNVSWQLTDPDQPDEESTNYARVSNEAAIAIAGVDRWPNYGLTVSLTGEAAEVSSTLRDFVMAAEYEFVTGTRSLEDYDAFTQEWLSKGGNIIIQQSAEKLGVEIPDYAK